MATSEQLEREAEATRAQISATLDELRGRMTPGQVVDQLVDYARDNGGAEVVRKFGQQVVGNPIPVTLVGAGLAWLMMAGRRAPARRDGVVGGFGMDDIAEGMSEAGREHGGAPPTGESSSAANVASLTEHAVRRAKEWARQTRGTAARVGEAGAGLQDRVQSSVADVHDAASAAYDTASERSRQAADALGRGAGAMRDNIAATSRGLWDFLQGQPLVLAGLGLAIGGLLGASLPTSETEDRLMGEASDAAKRQAKSLAQEQVDKGRRVAEEAWSAAKPEIDRQAGEATSAPGGGLAGEASRQTATGFGGEAPLVPSDQTPQAEAVGNGDRRDTEQHSG